MGEVEEITVAQLRVGDVIVSPSTGRPVWTITAIEPSEWNQANLWVSVRTAGGEIKRLLFSPPARYARQV